MMKPDKEKPKEAAKKPSGKVFDVRRPGKALASPTSRPVIMGHKPEAQQAQIAVSGVGEGPMLSRRKVQITPFTSASANEQQSESLKPNTAAQATAPAQEEEVESLASVALEGVVGPPALSKEVAQSVQKDESQSEAPKSDLMTHRLQLDPNMVSVTSLEEVKSKLEAAPAAMSEQEKTEPPVAPEEMPQDSSSLPDADESQVDATVEPTEQAPAPEPHIEPLFNDSGDIVVSHHGHDHRHHGLKVFALILLILILAVVGLDIVLDLGLFTVQGIPHTNYLSV